MALAKAAVHGDTTGAARQRNGSQYLDGLRHGAGCCAGRTRRRRHLRSDEAGSIRTAIDLDHCRDVVTGSVEPWAQLMLEQALHSYAEITPSGNGLRIWGTAAGEFVCTVNSRSIPATNACGRAVPRYQQGAHHFRPGSAPGPQSRQYRHADGLVRVLRGEAQAGTDGRCCANPLQRQRSGLPYSLDEIEAMVRTGELPPGANRSDLFHAIVGHYVGCGWDAEQITAHMGQFPDGIGGRYLSEGRLRGEVDRSVGKYNANALPASGVNGWANGWEAKAPQPDPELDDDQNTAPEKADDIQNRGCRI